MIIFKGNNDLTELDNTTYSECIVEREISVYSFYTHNRRQLEKSTTNLVPFLAQIGSWGFSCPHSPEQSASA